MKTFITLIYDSVDNAVFISQVLTPVRQQKQLLPEHQYVLISFERGQVSAQHPVFSQWPGPVHIIPKHRFWGRWSLWLLMPRLQKVLLRYASYEIRARGPHAGWLAQHAASSKACTGITIQARGLLAEEYRYVHGLPAHGGKRGSGGIEKLKQVEHVLHMQRAQQGQKPEETGMFYPAKSAKGNSTSKNLLAEIKNRIVGSFLSRVHALRAKWYEGLEHTVYRKQLSLCPVSIEAVSPALKDHLVTQWEADSGMISIAELDKPQPLSAEERPVWRAKIRHELGIPADAKVYCYSGSAKAWQCPDLVVSLFKHRIGTGEKDSFLVMYTQDPQIFEQEIRQQQIPADRVRILSVPADKVIQYCTAADAGILLREQSPVNWVSRPTKALEYHAAGLEIIHNGTVAWLEQFGAATQQLRP